MPTPRAPTNMSILFTRRKFFEATRSPAPAALTTGGRFPAIIAVDSLPPSVPTNLQATASSTTQINLTWTASTDTGGSGLEGYRIYRNGGIAPISTSSTNSFSDIGLTPATQYTYRVSAYDEQGNESGQSSTASATTQSQGNPNDTADWQSRISGTGVVWHHNFDTAAEVNNFRFAGGTGTLQNSPNSDTRWVADDGFAGGGCLEIEIPNNGTAVHGWIRPFSALAAGANANGRSAADPAANGTLPVRSWNATDVNQYNFQAGFYSHPDYFQTGYDGTDFYVQCRIKMSTNRGNAGNNFNGKLIYIDGLNSTNQELVVRSPLPNLVFDMYTNFGSTNNAFLTNPQQQGLGGTYDTQPGSEAVPKPWTWPLNEWVTVLIHITPGRQGKILQEGNNNVTYGNSSTANTGVEVWVARTGATSYTKIWSKLDYVWSYDPTPWAFSMLKLSGYMNGEPAVGGGFYHRFTQVIFSKTFIPCPNAAPTWFTSLSERAWTDIAGGTAYSGSAFQKGARLIDVVPSPYPGNGNPNNLIIAYNGALSSQSRREYLKAAEGGHGDGSDHSIYALGLSEDVPAWKRIWGPNSPGGNVPTNNSPGCRTSSNCPLTCHGWFSRVYSEIDGRIWLTLTNENSGNWTTDVWSIPRASLGVGVTSASLWTYHGRAWTPPNDHTTMSFSRQSAPTAYDRTAHQILLGASFAEHDGIRRIDCATAVAAGSQSFTGPQVPGSTLYTQGLGGNPGANAWSAVCHNTSPRCWIFASPNDNCLYVWNLESPGTLRAKNVTGGTISSTALCGAGYHAGMRKFVIGGPEIGSNLRTVAIPADPWNATSGFTMGTITAASGSITAASGYNGTNSQFQLIEDMGNGQACVVLHSRNADQPTYVMKLPTSF